MCYSFVMARRPPRPHRSVPMWSCFLGLLQPLLLWCFAFLLYQVLLNARLPRWPGFGTPVTTSPDQRDCQASREKDNCKFLRTNHSAACSNMGGKKQTKKTPTFNLSYFLSTKSLYHLFVITRCAYMCECEWVHVCMCPTCCCVRYRYAYETFWVPVCVLPCWYKLVTALCLNLFGCQRSVFPPWTQQTRIHPYESLLFISSWISSLTTFDLSDSYEWQACLLAHNVLLTNYRKK